MKKIKKALKKTFNKNVDIDVLDIIAKCCTFVSMSSILLFVKLLRINLIDYFMLHFDSF